jgi:hypothetical protein
LKSKIIDIAILALLSCAALVIVTPHLSDSLWYDEAYSVDLAKSVPFSLIETITATNNLPAYYIFMRAWTLFSGFSEPALRLPSVIFYLLSIWCVYFFGKRLFTGRGPAFASSLIYLLLYINTTNAANARPYGMLALLSIVSLTLFHELFILGKKSRLSMAAFIAVNIIGSFTHIWFFFTAFSQAVYYLAAKRRLKRRFVQAFLASFVPFFILWSPVLFSQAQCPCNDWMGFKKDEFGLTFNYFTAGNLPVVLFAFLIPVIAGFAAKITARKKYKPGQDETSLLFLLTVLFVSLLVPFIISFVKPIYIIDRGPIIAAAPFALLLGGYLCAISYKPLFYYILALFSVYLCIKLYSNPVTSCNTDRNLAKLVMANAADTDNIAFYGQIKRTMKYYLGQYHFNPAVTFTDLPEKMEARNHRVWIAMPENKRQEIFDGYCSSLCKGRKLLLVFTDEEAAHEPFLSVYENMNSIQKAAMVKKFRPFGVTLVKYEITKPF